MLGVNLLWCVSAMFAAAAPSCPDGMVALSKSCLDRFEAPNVAGAHPLYAKTAFEGEAWCAERGKRLCTEAEWVEACAALDRSRRFPYGARYAPGACNDSQEWIVPDWGKIARYPRPEGRREVDRLYQGAASGSYEKCVSEVGAYDLTGNVAEWVVRSYPNKSNFGHVLKGCYWAGCYGGSKPSCAFVNPAHPGQFRSYESGFRCCL